jgi:hypothetical protein
VGSFRATSVAADQLFSAATVVVAVLAHVATHAIARRLVEAAADALGLDAIGQIVATGGSASVFRGAADPIVDAILPFGTTFIIT